MNTQKSQAVEFSLFAAEVLAGAVRHIARHGYRPAAPLDADRPGAAVGTVAAIQAAARRAEPSGYDAGQVTDLFAQHLRESGRTDADGAAADVIATWEYAMAQLTANRALEPVAVALYAAAGTATRRVIVIMAAPLSIGRELSTLCLQPLPTAAGDDGRPGEEDQDDGVPTPEWIRLSQEIADLHSQNSAALRALLCRIRHLEPAVEAARIAAITAGMTPENWDTWYADELTATLPLEDLTAEAVRLAAVEAAPVILNG